MAVTALSVAISCSRSAGSPGSLVTTPEVMIITEGFNPTRYRDIRTLKKKVEDRVRAERDRSCQKEKSKEKTLGESGMRRRRGLQSTSGDGEQKTMI